MTTFSSTHRLDSLGPPAFGSRVTIHGCEEVTFWSVDGAAFELRFTRPNGVSINAPIGAAPANHFTLPLHPDEVVDVEAQSGTVSDIAVMVI